MIKEILAICDANVLEIIKKHDAKLSLSEEVAGTEQLQQASNEAAAASSSPLVQRYGSNASSGSSKGSGYSSSATMTPATPVSSLTSDPDTTILESQKVYPGTGMGWTIAAVLRTLTPTLTRDFLPFCFIHRESFIQDLFSLRTQYCSTVLVNALLSLALLTSGSALHTDFFMEAYEQVQAKSPQSYTLPDIQALGILCLHQLGCKEQDAAHTLVSTFTIAMAGYCTTFTRIEAPNKTNESIRSMTYCGAISLYRSVREGIH